MCSDGYGSGASGRCHRCDNTKAHLLIAMGSLFCLAVMLLVFLVVVFLVGGLDAIDAVSQSVGRTFSVRRKASSSRPFSLSVRLQEHSRPVRLQQHISPLDSIVSPVSSFPLHDRHGHDGGVPGGGSGGDLGASTSRGSKVFPNSHPALADTGQALTTELGSNVGVETGGQLSIGMSRYPYRKGGLSVDQRDQLSAVSRSGGGGGHASTIVQAHAGKAVVSKDGRFGDKVKRFGSRLPMDKLKILVAVWQILVVFSSITGVDFPAPYSQFLSWISVVNLDIGSIFSASCVLPSVNFYARLLITTLAPLALATGLVLTYQMAKYRAGIGSAGVIARRAAWSRHVSAVLILTFLVSLYRSVSAVA